MSEKRKYADYYDMYDDVYDDIFQPAFEQDFIVTKNSYDFVHLEAIKNWCHSRSLPAEYTRQAIRDCLFMEKGEDNKYKSYYHGKGVNYISNKRRVGFTGIRLLPRKTATTDAACQTEEQHIQTEDQSCQQEIQVVVCPDSFVCLLETPSIVMKPNKPQCI
jgi:hypothetical protein